MNRIVIEFHGHLDTIRVIEPITVYCFEIADDLPMEFERVYYVFIEIRFPIPRSYSRSEGSYTFFLENRTKYF